VYGWAGKFRTVSLSKGQTAFSQPLILHAWADREILPLFAKPATASASREDFALALASCWAN
jgi:fido (protein-threonine AMPylation protein)